MAASRRPGHRSRQPRVRIFSHKQEAENDLEVIQSSELLKPAPRDRLSPARLHHLNLFKQHHPLGTECSNV